MGKGMDRMVSGIEEAAARRILLAEAVETQDAQGKLLSTLEREQIDQLTLQAARHAAAPQTPAAELLDRRAQRMLDIVRLRSPALAALQEPQGRQRWLVPGALAAALLVGAASDRIANPHRVDLLSLPLLALVAWNLVVYLLLLAGWWRKRTAATRATTREVPQDAPALLLHRIGDALRDWRRRAGRLQAGVAAAFYRRWHTVGSELALQRWKKVLHAAAAGWGLGVMLSLFVRGLVVEYRVGWESTFLDAQQVHAVLQVLLAPVVWLLPFEPFTVQEVAALQFAQGQGAAAGARWVLMHASLLALVVVLPRLLLAWAAARRESALSHAVAVDFSTPYFQELLARLRPARLRLGLVAARPEDAATLHRVLRPQEAPAPGHGGNGQLVLRTDGGDELWLLPLHGGPVEAAAPPASLAGRGAAVATEEARPRRTLPALTGPWGRRIGASLRGFIGPAPAPSSAATLPDRCDFSLDADAAGVAVCDAAGHAVRTLRWADFALCWVQHPVLFAALGDALATPQRPALQRVARAWQERARERLQQAMRRLAAYLADAARQNEEARGSWSVTALVSPGGRRASNDAREAAMAAIAGRIAARAAQARAELRQLHGLPPVADEAAGSLAPAAHGFELRQAVHAPQAGMAGAATGAAMGASVDLAVGGLTLGAAAALGALAGGGIALATAAWRNRNSPSGATLVQPGDEMLQALAEQALHEYLAAAHGAAPLSGDAGRDPRPAWPQAIHTAVQPHRDALQRLWAQARTEGGEAATVELLAAQLEGIALEVLARLYPAVSIKEVQA